jgi:hypothetical protein
MVLGWPPSKFVSGDPDFQPRWPAERKISQKNLGIYVKLLLAM